MRYELTFPNKAIFTLPLGRNVQLSNTTCGVRGSAFFYSQHFVLRFLVGKVWIKGCNSQFHYKVSLPISSSRTLSR